MPAGKDKVISTAHNRNIQSLKGLSARAGKRRAISVKEMNAAIAEGFSNNEKLAHERFGSVRRRR